MATKFPEIPRSAEDAPIAPERERRLVLTLGHVLSGMGSEIDPPICLQDIHVIRHSFRADGLRGEGDLTEDRVLEYTRFQDISTKRFPADPARYWVVLIADGQRRSRLYGTFENRGEILAEKTAAHRYWDLCRHDFLTSLVGRLVVEWDNPRSWHRRANSAADMSVLEIADRDKVEFPGFDNVLLTFHELTQMVTDSRYVDWQVALSEVQGIYLVTDSSTGKHYVGKADGAERILSRWKAYVRDGHGGNQALRELAFSGAGRDRVRTNHARHYIFSLLRVFGPSTSAYEVNAAESHYKRALMTVGEFGLNRN